MTFLQRPTDYWPRAYNRNPRKARFGATLSNTIKKLEHELRRLRAVNTVIYFDNACVPDRWPGYSEQPHRIMVEFECPCGKLSYACDLFTEWHDNLRAIALTLKSLREASKYQVAADIYEGFRGLATAVDKEGPIEVLAQLAGVSSEEARRDLRKIRKLALRKIHPDTTGADQDTAVRQMSELSEAWSAICKNIHSFEAPAYGQGSDSCQAAAA